jgi:hypothetical protein
MEFEVGPTGAWWAVMRLARLPEDLLSGPRERRCPSCWSLDCAPGLPIGALDRFRQSRYRFPYECRACGKRFYWYQRDIEAPSKPAISAR